MLEENKSVHMLEGKKESKKISIKFSWEWKKSVSNIINKPTGFFYETSQIENSA